MRNAAKNLMNILLDPFIFAVPDNASQMTDYLENLYSWVAAVGTNCNKYWLSSEIVDALLETKRYPNWENLQLVQQQASELVYDVNTTLRACEFQLMEPPLLDGLFNNDLYYYDDKSVLLVPPEIEKRLPEKLSMALKQTLATAAIGRHFQLHPVFSNLVFGTVSAGIVDGQLNVNLDVHNLDSKTNLPLLYSLDMLFSPSDIDYIVNILDIWEDTARMTSYVHHKIYSSNQKPPKLPVIIASPAFNQSIINYNLHRQSAELFKIFRTIVLGLVGEIRRNQKEHHNLHNNGKPLSHGSSTAWRLWVEHSTPGWRVHYWLHSDGCIELATLVPHHNLTIPRPSREKP